MAALCVHIIVAAVSFFVSALWIVWDMFGDDDHVVVVAAAAIESLFEICVLFDVLN